MNILKRAAVFLFLTLSMFSFYSCESELVVTGGEGSGVYSLGDKVLVKADSPVDGFRFFRWDGSRYIDDIYSPTSEIKLMRKLTEISTLYTPLSEKYKLDVIKGSGTGIYYPGELVSIKADEPNDPKYRFSHWAGNLNYLRNPKVALADIRVLQEDLFFEAIYQEAFQVTISGGDGSGLYFENDNVTVTAAPPKEGYAFKEWIGDVSVLNSTNESTQTFKMGTTEVSLEATYQLGYRLIVNSGSGDGVYFAGKDVTIEAARPPSGYQFNHWTGDTEYLNDLESSKQTFEMPYSSITLSATFKEAPKTDLPHKTDFLTAGCYTHTIPGMSSSNRMACINNIKIRGYTHFYIYAYNENDYGAPSFNFYNDPDGFRDLLLEVINAGLKPVVWLVPDDAPVMAHRSSGDIINMFNQFIPKIDDLVSSYVLGLELDEYWGGEKVNELGSYLTTLTSKEIGVHQLKGKWNYCKYSWCDYMILQYGFGRDKSYISSMTSQAISDLRKPVVAGEYSHRSSEASVSIPLGNAGVAAGASGFGNGGTP